ncbi:hypothetical protein MCFN_02120 [Mycoplasmopsis californica]|uniref:Uncharacterized protein n=1 Tax=Mycoplasmopsis californica TaxID=2113 RepID=A0A059XWF5_9BACT|nr:hypothetical protein [Mycoplasmopsis californica]AIA29562.1 hypothetical protein MCFN_02120 [Mycoplasmopsis californica]
MSNNPVNVSESISLTWVFSFDSWLNLIIMSLILSPLIYQILLFRTFYKKHKLFHKNQVWIAIIKKEKLKNIITFCLIGFIGVVILAITMLIGELGFKNTHKWQSYRWSILASIVIWFGISLVCGLLLIFSYKKMIINKNIDWETVKNYCYKYNLNFKNKNFQIRWLDNITHQYEPENLKDTDVTWKKDYYFLKTFGKTRLNNRILRYYLAKSHTFFFEQGDEIMMHTHLLYSAVINQIAIEDPEQNIESIIANLRK